MSSKDPMLKLVEADENIIVLENLCKTPLDVAEHPWLPLDIRYISITRGKKHVLTAIKGDGTTWAIGWSKSEHPCLSEDAALFQKKVCDFILGQGLFIDLTGDVVNVKQWESFGAISIRIDGLGFSEQFFEGLKESDAERIKELAKLPQIREREKAE